MTSRNQMVHEILRQMPYGLYVVGVHGEGEGTINALVASWVMQCSFDPPLIVAAIRTGSSSYALVRKGKTFSLNLMDKKDHEIIRLLERPAHSAGDKLGQVAHVEEDTGAPILRRAFAYLECKVREIHESGDHALVVGEVVHAGKRHEGEPLMCADLNWHYGG